MPFACLSHDSKKEELRFQWPGQPSGGTTGQRRGDRCSRRPRRGTLEGAGFDAVDFAVADAEVGKGARHGAEGDRQRPRVAFDVDEDAGQQGQAIGQARQTGPTQLQVLQRGRVGEQRVDDVVHGLVVDGALEADAPQLGRQVGPVPAPETGRRHFDDGQPFQTGHAAELAQLAALHLQVAQVEPRQETKVEPRHVAVLEAQEARRVGQLRHEVDDLVAVRLPRVAVHHERRIGGGPRRRHQRRQHLAIQHRTDQTFLQLRSRWRIPTDMEVLHRFFCL